MSFQNLKRNRDQISKLVQAAESVGGSTETKSYVDERIWKPTVDKAGNGYAVYDSYQQLKVQNYLGYVIGIMGSKVQLVYGT